MSCTMNDLFFSHCKLFVEKTVLLTRSWPYIWTIILFLCISIHLFAQESPAEIYKYKDENGNWHFTDTPRKILPENNSFGKVFENPKLEQDLNQYLSKKLPRRNEIEQAINATLSVQSALGQGTGFFITTNGFILTNRHVLRGDLKTDKMSRQQIDRAKTEIKRIEKQFVKEESDLKAAKLNLDHYHGIIKKQSPSPEKKYNEEQYLKQLKQVEAWEKSLLNRKADFARWKTNTENKISAYKQRKLTADLSKTFKIFLADNTELDAYLVSVSKKHDLALLKLNGYVTPFLEPEEPLHLAPGEPVYAIGNPVTLRNSVAKGIISGFQQDFIKTDAKIYPGNSGGPLISKDGKVIGINTFKKLTRSFEGLGFAISISTALEEFREFLKTTP